MSEEDKSWYIFHGDDREPHDEIKKLNEKAPPPLWRDNKSNYLATDEEKTADYKANTNIFIPQFKPKLEKQFQVIFIVDISESMEIWQEMIDEFLKSIKNYAIFKSIAIYFIDIMQDEIICYKSKDKLRKKLLSTFSKDTLIFIMSDMYAQGWSNIKLLDTLYQWQEKAPLSIIQMLPYGLWRATILNHTTLTRLHSNKVFPKNEYLISRTKIKKEDDKVMKIPLLNFDTTSFDAYGRVMGAKPKNRIDGAIFNLSKLKEKKFIKDRKSLNSEQRVRKFYESASEPAKRLAEYLSVVPLKFPIMKIVQQKLLLETSQVYLSEVFMSALVDKTSNKDGIYRFYKGDGEKEGVRDILLTLLGTNKAIDTIITISGFISEREGAFDFLSFLNNPSSIEKCKEYDEIDREFARISAKILKNMGGSYAKLAQTLTEYIDEYEEIEIDEFQTVTPTSKRFQMGSDDGHSDEKPVHEVIINYDFEIAKYPVTFEEYDLFCEDTGREKPDDEGWGRGRRPVINVSWHDAKAYCKWLSEKTGETYRLPTEAEWEFVCRAGTTTKWSFGDDEKELGKYAWYDANSDGKMHPVGEKLPNPWGLYDMHGNVWEWCEDWFVDNYNDTPGDGSANENGEQKYKVLRGGSWYNGANGARSAVRYWYYPGGRSLYLGFRLLRTLPS